MSSFRETALQRNIAIHQARILEADTPEKEAEVLREAYGTIVRDLLQFDEDNDWTRIIGGMDGKGKGLSLLDIQEIIPYLEKQTKILGDLLGRGLRLKNNHVFGRGCTFEHKTGSVPPRFQAIIDHPSNQKALFSITALKEINRMIFVGGNIALRYVKSERRFTRLLLDVNVENYLTDEEDEGEVKYILRKWQVRNDLGGTGQPTEHREWIPTSTYDATNPSYPKTIKFQNENIPVNTGSLVILKAFNRDAGETWGVPDAFAAAAPAAVYNDYIRSGAMLQHALAAIAFVVKAKTEQSAKAAGAKVQKARVGSAVITGPETEVQSMPRAGSVNLYEGRPLAARVASALDVSTTGITSDTGTGGSYASENALSAPEQMSALSRQEDFANLFAEVFRVMGAKDMSINFRRLDTDPVHRQGQTLTLFRVGGAINQQEYRDRALELLDIDPTTTALPEPDEFTGSKYATLKDSLIADAASDQDTSGSPVPGKGKSGAVGSLDDANSARDSDRDAGTA